MRKTLASIMTVVGISAGAGPVAAEGVEEQPWAKYVGRDIKKPLCSTPAVRHILIPDSQKPLADSERQGFSLPKEYNYAVDPKSQQWTLFTEVPDPNRPGTTMTCQFAIGGGGEPPKTMDEMRKLPPSSAGPESW